MVGHAMNVMMMKKTMALIFVFMANMVLLAHAVVPHHHHTPVDVCLAADVIAADHEGVTNDPHASHDHSSTLECIIGDVIIRGADDKSGLVLWEYHPLSDFDFILPQTVFFVAAVQERECLTVPFRESLPSVFICRAFGLRAPPFTIIPLG